MSRRQARCAALQTLFQLDLNNILDRENAINAVLSITKVLKDADSRYMRILVNGAIDNKAYIDKKISSVSGDWHINRMPAVDRNILRIAVYELEFGSDDLTPKIIINEAVELAKQFGTDNSSRFINGVLGSIVKK
ncbi:transcription antitermination factor NusB [Pectinatus cerevisiiphilus]|uniref:Transcription antitermination protein NusB n=1 Tax=Pectinatus cerevisiiphilus TaxID=86956 RepID=A0A4R3K8F9_9FIRM|nr:transcription antitermination factor NusB [Pectinatus cerevisiiphilus]TCS79286.1 NusB antitermination factor [Pectinatus cerevisiiphilus]